MTTTKLDPETRDVLITAAREIRGLRNQIQLQSAKLEVLELFDIALRGRQGGQCMTVDTAWRIDSLIERDDMRDGPGGEEPAPLPERPAFIPKCPHCDSNARVELAGPASLGKWHCPCSPSDPEFYFKD